MALNRVELLEDLADRLAHPPTAERDRIKGELQDIAKGLTNSNASIGKRLRDAWSGDDRSRTWAKIHLLEADLEYLKRPDEAVDDARRIAVESLGLQRLKQFEAELLETGKRDAEDNKHQITGGEPGSDQDLHKLDLALGVIRDAHADAAIRHEAERQQQRGIVALSSLLLLGALATALLQWRVFPLSPLVPPPKDAEGLSSGATLGLVMFFGLIGGGFSALIALYVTNRIYTRTYWFDPRPAMAFMKVSVGVWSAVFGVLGVASGLVVGTYSNFASLVVLAFLFGYGQQVLTGFIDKRAESLGARTPAPQPEAQAAG